MNKLGLLLLKLARRLLKKDFLQEAVKLDSVGSFGVMMLFETREQATDFLEGMKDLVDMEDDVDVEAELGLKKAKNNKKLLH